MARAQAEFIQHAEDQAQIFYDMSSDDLTTMFLLFSEIGAHPDQLIPQMVTHWTGFIRGVSMGRDKIDPAMQIVTKGDMQALLGQEPQGEAEV